MSAGVWITKNGLRATEWDGESGQYADKPVATFLTELRTHTEIESGVTLGDIFRAVDADPPLKALLGKYSWCDVDAFHAEAREASEKGCLEYIEIGKRFEFDADHGGECLDVYGVGKPDDHSRGMTCDADGNIRWGIDLMPLNELVHLPVRLNATLEILKDYAKIGETRCTFTLLDILGEIYYEISFHGSPEKRDAFRSQLMVQADEIERGEAELIPLDALRKKEWIQ